MDAGDKAEVKAPSEEGGKEMEICKFGVNWNEEMFL